MLAIGRRAAGQLRGASNHRGLGCAISSRPGVGRFLQDQPFLNRRPASRRRQSTAVAAREEFQRPTAARKKALWARSRKSTSFVDELEIEAEGGAGGDGCIAFQRDKFKPYGPPSGAGGGAGGNIYVRAREGIASLARLPGRVAGAGGENGTGDWQAGKAGIDRVIDVPVGTVVRVQRADRPEYGDEARQWRHHDRLVGKYRNAYLRERRAKPSSLPLSVTLCKKDLVDGDEPSSSSLELRAERDLVWRHYPGAVLPADPPSREEDAEEASEEYQAFDQEQDSDAEFDMRESEEQDYSYPADSGQGSIELDPESAEADSDILSLGTAFRNSEKRFAFWLIEQRRREAAEHSAQMTETEAQEYFPEDAIQATGFTVDLDKPSEEPLLVARGGFGGLGNSYFVSAQTRSPTSATRGSAGEQVMLQLEWKFKGDIGLIGMPNAGKSTFLKAASSAGDNVRVAGYAFTTLQPNVGIVRIGEHGSLLGTGIDDITESMPRKNVVDGSRADAAIEDEAKAEAKQMARRAAKQAALEDEAFRFTLQDLPGLVEGAAVNRGLGHDFLRHIERCTGLYYVVDVSSTDDAGHERSEPWVDLELVHAELEEYRAGLSEKVQGVLANKCDKLLETEEGRALLSRLRDEAQRIHGGREIPVFHISARKRQGVQPAIHAMARVVAAARRKEEAEKEEAPLPD